VETLQIRQIRDESILDGTFFVKTEEAYEMASRLAREEGLLVGPSSGAVFRGALKLAESLDFGAIVTIFPDGGDRYFSTTYKSLR
jgi:cysteine synthase